MQLVPLFAREKSAVQALSRHPEVPRQVLQDLAGRRFPDPGVMAVLPSPLARARLSHRRHSPVVVQTDSAYPQISLGWCTGGEFTASVSDHSA
jgi:hypothetical protein